MCFPGAQRPGGRHARRKRVARHSLAELGIGPNPSATLTSNGLDDEKVIGTMRLAFGTRAGIGRVEVAGVHIDGIVLHLDR